MAPTKWEEFQDTEKVRRTSGKVGETPGKGAGSPVFFGDPLNSGCIVQHGESPRKAEELLETAVTGKRHRRNAKNFKTPKKKEELRE